MAIIYNTIESLTHLKDELSVRNIARFQSVGDITKFQRNYDREKKEIYESSRKDIFVEIEQLNRRIDSNEKKLLNYPDKVKIQLNSQLDDLNLKIKGYWEWGWFKRFRTRAVYKDIDRRKKYLEENFSIIVKEYDDELKSIIQKDKKKKQNILNDIDVEIIRRSRKEIEKIESLKNTIDGFYPLVSGAIGENKVVNEIKKLSDDYFLINDFQLEFNKPIYNPKEDEHIYSVQIDHLLISPSGIFIIETKNWSKKSVESIDLRSPVKQILRSSFVLYIKINEAIQNKKLKVSRHHWGEKKIPIRNLIVMINNKPQVDFQFVKIKRLDELNSYILYFEPIFNNEEVENIYSYLRKKKSR
jgi:hypothetical protein